MSARDRSGGSPFLHCKAPCAQDMSTIIIIIINIIIIIIIIIIISKPLVEQIVSQSHQLPEDSLTKLAQQEVRSERSKELEHRAERIKEMAPRKTQRALDLATEKGSSAWLTVLPLQGLGFDLNKREFRDAVKLRYDWPVEDIPSTCACGEAFTVDHSMICKLGGFITQRHNELRDLEAEFLSMVCSDVEIEPVLQDISGEHLNRGSNKAQDARLDIHARGFWERHRSAFFDVRVCHPNAVSYRDLEPQQIYRIHENEQKASLLRESPGHRAWNIYTLGLHHNWRNGKGVLEVS